MNAPEKLWLTAATDTAASYRRTIDAAVEQLSYEELRRRPAEGVNSVAVILRHLGGNLQSRWHNFLTTDGEKPDRDRDAEFADWEGDRSSLAAYFEEGWRCLIAAIERIDALDPATTITIRGEAHTLPQALMRSLAHLAYHVGQIVMIARTVHEGEWRWLTIAPGGSAEHNRRTWGTSASRATMGAAAADRTVRNKE